MKDLADARPPDGNHPPAVLHTNELGDHIPFAVLLGVDLLLSTIPLMERSTHTPLVELTLTTG